MSERVNRFDRAVNKRSLEETAVTKENEVVEDKTNKTEEKIEDNNKQKENSDVEQVETKDTTTIVNGKVENNTKIIKKEQSTLSQLSNLKSNELISKIVKKSQEKDELAELMKMFPNMTRNQITNLFIEEILKQREKEIRRRMMGYTKKKSKMFKDSFETFSFAVRPEMKELLNIISLFSGSNKYMFFEDFLLKAIKDFDFDAYADEIEEFEE